MSDNGEVEVESPADSYAVLPKEVTSEIGSIKLFNKWSYEDVEIRDISLTYAEILAFPGPVAKTPHLQRLRPNPITRLHLTLGRPICCEKISKSAMPYH